jgi:hypothetical protein
VEQVPAGVRKQHKNFLPRNGDHPAVTIQGAYTEWDTASKATNRGHETNVPVDFPENTVKLYKEYNIEYIPLAPVKREQAESIISHQAVFLEHHCRLSPPAVDLQDADQSRSPSPALNPKDIVKWNVLAPDSIPFDTIEFYGDINLTTNCSFHAVAMLLFMDQVLAGKWPEKKNALHAGWMATFKHPINYKELKRQPCVGPSAYNAEEQNWCSSTLQYYVDGMDAVQRAARCIPDSAVSALARRRSGSASACCIEASVHPHGSGAPGGVGRDGASATGGSGRGSGSASTKSGP